jgi:hypothetical protein
MHSPREYSSYPSCFLGLGEEEKKAIYVKAFVFVDMCFEMIMGRQSGMMGGNMGTQV